MIEKLIELANGRLVIPLIVVVAGVALVKGAFHLTRSGKKGSEYISV